MNVKAWFCLQLLSVVTSSAALAANAPDAAHALRAAAVTIEQEIAAAEQGQAPAPREIERLRRTLDDVQRLDTAGGFAAKHHAVRQLLDRLQHAATHARSAFKRTAADALDREVIRPGHGMRCVDALGVSPALPVAMTLAAAGQRGGEAWLRFDPARDGVVAFHTDSLGADPALQVYTDCAGDPVAANDDALGLDAAVAVAAEAHAPLYVRLTNSGGAGPALVAVDDAAGTISGTVTDGVTHAPVAGAYVELVSQQGGYYAAVTTDQSGHYSISPSFPPAGPWYVLVSTGNYVAQLYPSALCLPGYSTFSLTDNCDLGNAQLVSLQSGQTVTGIDLALSSGQSIVGTVRDVANAPIANVFVRLFDGRGFQLGGAATDANGAYRFATLPPHAYKAQAEAGNYTSQLYDHVACAGALQDNCNPADGTTIQLGAADIAGIDFNLQRLAAIQGTVRDVNAMPLPGAQVMVVDSSGSPVAYASSDYLTGAYTAGPLGVGSYRVYATASRYFAQAWSGLDCASSDCAAELPDATPIAITQLGQQPQADFALQALPAVTGRVQDAQGRALQGVAVYATTSTMSNYIPASALTDQNGNYRLQPDRPGQYFIWAVSPAYIDEIYPDIVCEAFDNLSWPQASCNVSGATLATVAPGASLAAFDFTLQLSARIAGNVTVYAGPGSRVPAFGAAVRLYNGANEVLQTAQTDGQGNYYFQDLPPGNYYAEATSYYSPIFYSQVWPAINCGGNCIPTTGSAIPVTSTTSTTGIDFSLIELDAIVGRVTDGAGDPLAGQVVDVFSSPDGRYVLSSVSDPQGFYVAQVGTGFAFFVATEASAPYVNEVFPGIPCPLGSAYYGLCALTQGTAISFVTPGSQAHVANFVLQVRDEVFASGFE